MTVNCHKKLIRDFINPSLTLSHNLELDQNKYLNQCPCTSPSFTLKVSVLLLSGTLFKRYLSCAVIIRGWFSLCEFVWQGLCSHQSRYLTLATLLMLCNLGALRVAILFLLHFRVAILKFYDLFLRIAFFFYFPHWKALWQWQFRSAENKIASVSNPLQNNVNFSY